MKTVRSQVWADTAEEAGFSGAGICAAVMDTGIYPHEDFGDRLIACRDFVNGKKYPYDDNGHGTHVAGVIGGDGRLSGGTYRGIAPGVWLISLKVLDYRGNGSVTQLLQGIQWILKNKDRYDIRIVNISVGGSRWRMKEDSLLVRQVNALWDAGLTVVAAAGNEGPVPGSITSPGISRKVITVGTLDDTEDSWVSGVLKKNYSGRGPTENCILKPEIVAPGAHIISCGTHGDLRNSPYIVKGGTSMSTPVVSGAVALLMEKYPYMTNKDIKLWLRSHCDYFPDKRKAVWGSLNIKKLLEL